MILVVDDDNGIRASLNLLLRRAGYETITAASPAEAIAAVKNGPLQLIIMDMNYSLSTSGDEGLILLRQVKLFQPEVPVILMTAWGSIPLAVKGIQAGAVDFVTKPWDNRALLQQIETALALAAPDKAKAAAADAFDRGGIIGHSHRLLQVLDTVKRVSATNAPVLITGENGTGKEMIAEAIHRNSRRKDAPFIKVNIGGIPPALFESEMFGHRRGAYTGAVDDRMGRFEAADGGTIFLDEIGELDKSAQVKLLRVLQEHTVERLGENRARRVDVRVVCATNADLPDMVRKGTFREDLFYRINLISLHMPSLDQRRDDIPELAAHFARKAAEEGGLPRITIADSALQRLSRMVYPGNIRQLKNIVESSIIVSGKDTIEADDIVAPGVEECHGGATADNSLDSQERLTIVETLRLYDNNLSRTAQALGITRQSLYRRIAKYGITV